jgi:hypothetical protein
MNLENLAYALTQVVHNFGAVTVIGGAIFARWTHVAPPLARRRVAWLVLVGWLLQAASGLGFGAISYINYGQFPDIHGIAIAALYIKMACAVVGIVLSVALLRYANRLSAQRQTSAWTALVLVGVVALTAAAFLRWFS